MIARILPARLEQILKYIFERQQGHEAIEVAKNGLEGDRWEAYQDQMERHIARHPRPLKRAVKHVILSLAPGEMRLPNGQPDVAGLAKIATAYMKHTGYGDCPWVAAVHTDAKQLHTHVAVVRIPKVAKATGRRVAATTGKGGRARGAKAVKEWRDRYLSRRVCNQIEAEMNLVPTAPAGQGRRSLSRSEWAALPRDEAGVCTLPLDDPAPAQDQDPEIPPGDKPKLPPRVVVRRACEDVLRRLSVTEPNKTIEYGRFVRELRKQQVEVRLNIAPGTRRISGISFMVDGKPFKGSAVAPYLSWGALTGTKEYARLVGAWTVRKDAARKAVDCIAKEGLFDDEGRLIARDPRQEAIDKQPARRAPARPAEPAAEEPKTGMAGLDWLRVPNRDPGNHER